MQTARSPGPHPPHSHFHFLFSPREHEQPGSGLQHELTEMGWELGVRNTGPGGLLGLGRKGAQQLSVPPQCSVSKPYIPPVELLSKAPSCLSSYWTLTLGEETRRRQGEWKQNVSSSGVTRATEPGHEHLVVFLFCRISPLFPEVHLGAGQPCSIPVHLGGN